MEVWPRDVMEGKVWPTGHGHVDRWPTDDAASLGVWPRKGVSGGGVANEGVSEGRGLTRVEANADADGHLGHVAHLEGAHGAEDVEGHVGDLAGVAVPVALGQPRGHHVGVPDGLHLRGWGRGGGHGASHSRATATRVPTSTLVVASAMGCGRGHGGGHDLVWPSVPS